MLGFGRHHGWPQVKEDRFEFLRLSQPGHRPSCPSPGAHTQVKTLHEQPLPLLGQCHWELRALPAPRPGCTRCLCLGSGRSEVRVPDAWSPARVRPGALEHIRTLVAGGKDSGKQYTGPGLPWWDSTRTLLLLQGASQPAGRPLCPPLCGRPGLSTAWETAGRDFGKAGLESAQMGSGRWTWQPLWLSPRGPVWPGQPQALAEASAHLLEFQRQMF